MAIEQDNGENKKSQDKKYQAMRRQRNIVLGFCVVGLVVIIYVMALVRFSSGEGW